MMTLRNGAAALAVLCAAPASAQDLCGGAGAGGQWIGGGEGASDMATADSYREQMALVLSGNEYVSLFSLSAPTDIRIEAAGRGNGDPTIDLLDSDGNLVLSDDDSGGNGAARAETTLNPGTYCVKMISFDGAPMTAFVRISRAEQEALTDGAAEAPAEDTPNIENAVPADCTTAPSLGTLDAAISGTGNAITNPVWRFSLATATPVSVTAENETADPTLTVTDLDGTVLGENDDFDGLNSRVDISSPLSPGDYCIAVNALSDENAPITVTVDTFDAQAALAGLYERGEAAPPLDGSVSMTDLGTLSARLRQDVQVTDSATWMSFDVPAAGLVVVEAIGAGGTVDPWLALFDDLGRQVAQNDDFGDGLDSQIMARVTPGTYLLAVKQVGDGQGFVRLLAERFVPATD